MTAAQHSCASVDHYTPAWIVEGARKAMGSIDLDPASCAFANELVRAPHIYTGPPHGADGLDTPWKSRLRVGTVFVNPPTPCAVWFRKAALEFYLERAKAIVFVAFSNELFQTAQQQGDIGDYEHATRCPHPLDFTICIPKTRVSYDRDAREWLPQLEAKWTAATGRDTPAMRALTKKIAACRGAIARADADPPGVRFRVRGDSPPHSSSIILMARDEEVKRRFREEFAQYGRVFG